MRLLVLLRHAKAARPESMPDVSRPLSDAGRRNAPYAGRWLAEHVGAIDLVLMSPAERVRQTWALVAPELPGSPAVQEEPALYLASLPAMLALLRDVPDDVSTVLVIGHNPDLSVLASALSGTEVVLSTSGIAVLEVNSDWHDLGPGAAQLRDVAKPRP
ncbi:MAG TPA: histidine phosphatase family protein [Jatrophihabitans sp.]|jgi:phosphohistidine phosphatase